MKEAYLFAADLGASGGKCFTGRFGKGTFSMREVHRFLHEPVSFYLPDAEGGLTERTYWDDVLLYDNIIRGLRIFRREIGPSLESIGIDAWGSDGQFVTPDGDVAGKVYCYRDHRLDTMVEAIKRELDPGTIYSQSGVQFENYNISNQLYWFMKNRGHTLIPGSVFLPTPSLFYFYLGNVKMVDWSWAGVTQLMDARTRMWSTPLLEGLGIPEAVMPEIVRPGTVVGELTPPLADSLKLGRASLTAVASHDTACAYAAAPVSDPAEALIISSGTWSLVGRLIPEPITTTEALQAGLSNEGGIDNIRFLKNCMGTWIVQELRRLWREQDGRAMEWEEITALTRKAEPFTAFIDPDDNAFYNPENMQEAIRSYCARTGQKPPGDRSAFLRVVYESLALKYRMVNEEISALCGRKSRAVHIVGGGCKNAILNQCTADATGLPVIAGPQEASAAGNLLIQAEAIGVIEDEEDRAAVIEGFGLTRYVPGNTREWDRAFGVFRKIAENG